MRDGRYECAQCGALLEETSFDAPPQVTIYAVSGQPNVRILSVGDREIHRCSVDRGNGGTRPGDLRRFSDLQREFATRARTFASAERSRAERGGGSTQLHLDAAVAHDQSAALHDRMADRADRQHADNAPSE